MAAEPSCLRTTTRFFAKEAALLKERGARFKICANALAEHGIDPARVWPECEIVPAGLVEVVRLQREGFCLYQAMNKKLSAKELAARAQKILPNAIPTRQPPLLYKNPWELLVAVVLSAQCTDARVNMVTPDLFARWPGPGSLRKQARRSWKASSAPLAFRQKAKNLRAAAKLVAENFAGQVPRSMEELVSPARSCRKTANVVLLAHSA